MTSRARLANEAWESLLTAHASLMRRFAADEDVWEDLTMREYDVLYTLSRCAAPISLAQLNRHVLLSQPAMSRMVDRLVVRGLVERERSARDGRSIRLSLSAGGREIQRRVGLRHGADVADALGARIDRADMEALARICAALSQPDSVVAVSEVVS